MPLNLSGTDLLALIGIPAGVQVAQGIIGSNAASNAANQQVQATQQAAQTARDAQRDALNLYGQIYAHQAGLQQPTVNRGEAAGSRLAHLMGLDVPNTPGPSFTPMGPSGGGVPAFGSPAAGGMGPQQSSGPGVGSMLGQLGLAAAPALIPSLLGGLGGAAAPISGSIGAMATSAGAGSGGGAVGGGILGGLGAGTLAALGGGAAAGIAIPWLKSQAHWEANDWVQNAQNPLDDYLRNVDQMIESGQVAPEQGAQARQSAIQQTIEAARKFAREKGDDGKTVIRQWVDTFNKYAGPAYGTFLDPKELGV